MKLRSFFKQTFPDLLYLFFPHTCIGCGSDLVSEDRLLCVRCFQKLPFTHFEDFGKNPVEKIFYGRTRIHEACAILYFTKDSIVQHLIFELKYRGNEKAGLLLGNLMANAIIHSPRFQTIDLLIPMPINEKRLRQRGYNQADILIKGIQEKLAIPSSTTAVIRSVFTETQTHKDRTSRWQTMQTVFSVTDSDALRHKNILIVDDVITTGATVEALTSAIHNATDCTVNVIAAAWTSQ